MKHLTQHEKENRNYFVFSFQYSSKHMGSKIFWEVFHFTKKKKKNIV